MDLEKLYVYDCETFSNTFSICIANAGRRTMIVFEISDRKNEIEEMMRYLRKIYKEDAWMVGFNNVGFDYPVLHYIMKNHKFVTVEEIYEFAMNIIESQNEDKFANIIPDYKQFIKQIDLMRVHHFDNKARMTSLKVLEFNMLSDNIEDLPFPVGSHLDDDQKDILIQYNKHDVKETVKFLEHSMNALEFREKLSLEYDRNFMNHNDTKIGKDYFVMKLEEEIPGSCYVKGSDGKRRPRQTKRPVIDLGECILPYIKFERPEFKAVLDWMSKQKITETKGVFTDIPAAELGDLAQYSKLRKKKHKFMSKPTPASIEKIRKKFPYGEVVENELKSGKISYYWEWMVADSLNVVVDGFEYGLGVGGVHGSKNNTIVESSDDLAIVSVDFASYYPHLSIVNRLYPEHLGETFCDIYKDVYDQRKMHPKGTPENAVMKLALNGTYGASNDQFSPFYDSKFMMSITINGQLTLLMLAEKLLEIPTVEILLENTDGKEFSVSREYLDDVKQVISDFEKLVGIPLEFSEYKKLCIADVNNYIGVSDE